ncbi:MAG: hypothetical protein ABIH00_11910 [Armatimonadota bacterium]
MKKEHFEVILEDINSKLSTVVEGHKVLDNKIERLDKKIDINTKELRDEMAVRFDYSDRKIDTKIDEVKHEIKKTNNVLTNHEQRITKLESRAA